MKRKIILLVLCILIGVFILYPLVNKYIFPTHFTMENVEYVAIDHSGDTVKVTEAEDINLILDYMNNIGYSRSFDILPRGGWTYRLRFYDSQENLIFEFIFSDTVEVNDKKYDYVNKNDESVEKFLRRFYDKMLYY